jgi:hypothetical protein
VGLIAFPLVPAVIGFLLLRAATAGARYCRHDLFRLALSSGLGTGLTSCTYFCSLLAGVNCIFFDAILLAIAAGLWFRFGRSPCIFCVGEPPARPIERQAPRKLLPWALAIVSLGACLLYLSLASQAPHGGWDAWSIYNMRARFLFRSGPAWQAAFHAELAWAHPDYPLLLPGSIARIWTYLSHESPLAPAGAALGFVLATAVLLVTVIRILKDRTHACAAGILLVSAPFFTTLAAWQYADVPVAFFLLAAVALTCLEDRFPLSERRLACLAGLSAGMLAWTKNEGLMLMLVFTAFRAAPMFFGPRKRSEVMRYVALVTGASLPLACVAYFKLVLAPANDLIAGQTTAAALARSANAGRYIDVALAFANHIFTFAGIALAPVIVLAVYVFCFGIAKPLAPSLRLAWCILLAAITGYFVIYIVSPGDLTFRLTGSIDRILIQLWPSILLTSILTLNKPS